MAKSRARDLTKEALWRRQLARHADSGHSVRGWCRRHGVKEAVFHWWRRELVRRDAEQVSAIRHGAIVQASGDRDHAAVQGSSARRVAEVQAGSFVPVRVTEDSARDDNGQIEIELTDGRRIRVTGTVNREMLTEVLAVLTACPLSQQVRSLQPGYAGSSRTAAERRVC